MRTAASAASRHGDQGAGFEQRLRLRPQAGPAVSGGPFPLRAGRGGVRLGSRQRRDHVVAKLRFGPWSPADRLGRDRPRLRRASRGRESVVALRGDHGAGRLRRRRRSRVQGGLRSGRAQARAILARMGGGHRALVRRCRRSSLAGSRCRPCHHRALRGGASAERLGAARCGHRRVQPGLLRRAPRPPAVACRAQELDLRRAPGRPRSRGLIGAGR